MDDEATRRTSRGTPVTSYELPDDPASAPAVSADRGKNKGDDDDDAYEEEDPAEEDEDEEVDDQASGESEVDEIEEEVLDSEDDKPGRKFSKTTISTAAAALIPVKRRQPQKKLKKPKKAPERQSKTPRSANSSGTVKVKNVSVTPLRRMRTNRGVDEDQRGTRGMGKLGRLQDLFGPSEEDLAPIYATISHWKGLEAMPRRSEGDLKRSYFVGDERWQREVDTLRQWYSKEGETAFYLGQKCIMLDEEEGALCLPNHDPESLNVVMGAIAEQKLYTLNKRSFMSTSEPFEVKEDRRGWTLYLGSKIRDAQWAANEGGQKQFLAVAVEQKMPKELQENPADQNKAPAFSATPPYEASVQIWSFQAIDTGEMDASKPPRLELVICTDWGEAKHLRWCPIATADSPEIQDDTIHLGLLAGIWSDGKLRILDVFCPIQHEESSKPYYIQYARAAFEVEFPYTIPSCIHWLSGTTIAAGTASGMLGIWTLERPNMFRLPDASQKKQNSPTPWFYKQVADTFIISLSSGFPSRSNFISITTADGFAKLIDLRDDKLDTALTQRGRIFCNTQAWHDFTQSFLMPDEAYVLRSNTIRRYYSNIHVMRLEAQITCVATSAVQPGVLCGGADGIVAVTNTIPRVLRPKEVPWQQIWFAHEWRRPLKGDPPKPQTDKDDEENNNENTSDNIEKNDTTKELPTATNPSGALPDPQAQPATPLRRDTFSRPLVRITEGYKLEQRYPHPFIRPETKNTEPDQPRDVIRPLVIHEEPTSITTVAWNPNLKFGTWAVAGTGSGLLRVEDVGV